MKKLKNGFYKVAIIVEDGDFNLSDGSSFSGKFTGILYPFNNFFV